MEEFAEKLSEFMKANCPKNLSHVTLFGTQGTGQFGLVTNVIGPKVPRLLRLCAENIERDSMSKN